MFKKDDVIRVVRADPRNIARMPTTKRLIGKVGVIEIPNLKDIEDREISVVKIDGDIHLYWFYNSEIEIDETNQNLEPGNLSGLFYVKGS